MLNPKSERNSVEIVNHVLIVAVDASVRELIRAQLVNLLGFSLLNCETETEFQRVLADQPSDILLAIVDLSSIDTELFAELEQRRIPAIGVFHRRGNCPRVSGKQIVASIDRDSDEQLGTLPQLVEDVFKNRRTRIVTLHKQSAYRDYLDELLSMHYYTVMQAEDVAETMELLSLYPRTQLLLVDEKCVEVGTLNVVKLLRKTYPRDHLAIIGMTVQRDPSLAANLFRAGANDVVTTSLDDEEFLARVQFQSELINTTRSQSAQKFRDSLTQAYTMDYFEDVGRKLFANAQRGKTQLLLAAVNIDQFAAINQKYGAPVGDLVLRNVAEKLASVLRVSDFVARKEGDEFFCLITCVDCDSTAELLERVRKQVEADGVWYGQERLELTLSIGATMELGASLESMMLRTELALTQARKKSGNCLTII